MRLGIVNLPMFGRFSDAVEKASEVFEEVVRIEIKYDLPMSEVVDRLLNFDILIVAASPNFDKILLSNLPKLLAVIRWGVGYDNVDLEAATEEGIIVSRIPGYILREAVAEMTIGLMLAALRRIPNASRYVRGDRWMCGTEDEFASLVGEEVEGKTIGIIGLGNIGSRVLELLKVFNPSKIMVYDPYLNPSLIRAYGAEPVPTLEELLQDSDIVTIHSPLTPETEHILNRDRFKLMKKGVYIINTSRGKVIDTEALLRALEEGVVAFAALDVVEDEPIGASHRLLKYENVLVTPHIGSATRKSYSLMDSYTLMEAVRICRGEKPLWILNPEVLKSERLRIKSRSRRFSQKIG